MFELSLLCPEERVDVLSDALDALEASETLKAAMGARPQFHSGAMR